jgi:hypothetical protein
MGNYLAESGLDLEDIYAGNRSWSDLCEAADVETHRAGPHEEVLRRAVGRLLHVDDPERLSFARRVLAGGLPDPAQMPERERRLLRMLTVALADQALGKSIDESMDLDAAVRIVWSHPQVRAEVTELFALLDGQLDHLHPVVGLPEDVPLSVHARYTRLEIQSALADAKGNAVRPPTWREGVRWLDDAQTDVFVFTLDKTDSGFSPTTRYRDYAISRELIHWESQSMTRADSPTGRRYRQHVERGSSVLLFARLNKTERAFWFLGPAQYVSHRSEQPMQVTWRLEAPLPGDLYAQFAAAVA